MNKRDGIYNFNHLAEINIHKKERIMKTVRTSVLVAVLDERFTNLYSVERVRVCCDPSVRDIAFLTVSSPRGVF